MTREDMDREHLKGMTMQTIPRPDLRLHRARAMASAIVQELDLYIQEGRRAEAYGSLLSLLYKNGLSAISDADRASLGLEPRDDAGWTASETAKFEQALATQSCVSLSPEYDTQPDLCLTSDTQAQQPETPEPENTDHLMKGFPYE